MGIIESLRKENKEITRENWLSQYKRVTSPDILSPADLSYVISDDFLGSASKYPFDVWSYEVTIEGDRYARTIRDVGILKQINDIVNKKGDISPLLIKVFIYYFSALKKSVQSDALSKIISYIVENNEDDLFELISFEKYKFETYDKKVTEEVNKYLLSDPKVYYLEAAVLRKYGSYIWGSDNTGPSIKKSVIAAVDPSLLDHQVERYKKPFKLIGRGNTEQAGTNNAKLEENSNFSDFKISNVPSNNTGWWPNTFGGPKISVKKEYNEFLLTFLLELDSLSGNKELEYNDQKVQKSFDDSIIKYLNTKIKFSLGSFTTNKREKELTLKEYIAKKLLDTFRYAAWLKFVKEFENRTDDEILNNGAKIIAEAFAAGEKAAKESPFSVPEQSEDDEPDEEEIAARQKFLKQCMLMTRLDDLANENLTSISMLKTEFNARKFIHYKDGTFAPYRNRFYMVEDTLYTDGDQSSLVNKLLIPNGNSIREFLDIKPSTHAYLIPKLRFYKVYTGKDGKLKEFPFHFRNFTDPSRVNKLSDVDFDRGGDYGIKNFDFSFQGATPATAKNDIKASLSLYFQTFSDFIDKKFTDDEGEKHAFVDLLLLPSGKKKEGSGAPAIFQFDAKHYRIRVDVGWEIDSVRVKDLEQSIGINAAANLKKSIQLMNKSFFLNMIDHTMDFRDDGSIQIDVEYRAYIESSLKGTSLDALASPEARKALKIVRSDYEKVLSKNRCSAKELNQIRLQLEQIEDLFKKQAYQSIMKRLIINDSIKFKTVKADGTQAAFLRRGYLTEKITFGSDNKQPTKQMAESSKQDTHYATDESGFQDLNNNDDYLRINFFYLGDLLYAILDTLYDDNEKYIEGFEKFKFVFGSFQYEDLTDVTSDAKIINLANIPVSCELFFEWFTDNITKEDRNSYPIMLFMRHLCTYLISSILSESCFKRSYDKSLEFKTMNFMGLSKNENKDPLGSLYNYSSDALETIKDELVLDVGQKYKNNQLPLVNDLDGSNSIADFYNYVTIYAQTPRQKTNKDANTTRSQDEADGIMHYKIGRDRGILKKIKFSKSDMQYVREARFFRHGHDGLMQLAAVYKVSLDMIGNTLYYPGMEVYIDPLGLVGANSEADPRQKRSVANRLGFGGYHLVTNVKSSIGPGKFTTNVEALFSYSGDGDPSSTVIGRKAEIKKDDGENNIDEPPDDRPQSYKDYCATIKNKVIDEALEISRGQNYYESIDSQSAEDKYGINPANLISQGATQEQIDMLITSNNDIELKDLTYDDEDKTFIETLPGGSFTEFKIVNGVVTIIGDEE